MTTPEKPWRDALMELFDAVDSIGSRNVRKQVKEALEDFKNKVTGIDDEVTISNRPTTYKARKMAALVNDLGRLGGDGAPIFSGWTSFIWSRCIDISDEFDVITGTYSARLYDFNDRMQFTVNCPAHSRHLTFDHELCLGDGDSFTVYVCQQNKKVDKFELKDMSDFLTYADNFIRWMYSGSEEDIKL